MPDFVHLHCHSEYSLLDGLCRLKPLVKQVKELHMPAIALTDHGVMYGALEFYRAAEDAGIKPIIGCELYIARRDMRDKDPEADKKSHHLVVLAENETGYRNLLQIVSAAQLEGFYYKPRVDHAYLESHAAGLIALSACKSGEVIRAVEAGQEDESRKLAAWHKEVFGPGNYFIELQAREGLAEMADINRELINIARELDIPLVATNDVHYIAKEDAAAQELLLAIQTGNAMNDPKRMRMEGNDYYLRTPDEMHQLFKGLDQALKNTLLIAERCNLNLDTQGFHLPNFDVPKGFTEATYLRQLAEKGLAERYGLVTPELKERLDYELGVIHKMGFDQYFLIVWDLVRYAQEQGIWYNIRGSAAGSLVAYTLGITALDPLKHNLIFERFLNPGRVTMPDIDMDFPDDRRGEMIEYAIRKYGKDRVAQIITFGTLGAKAAIRDVARAIGISLSEADRVARLVPFGPKVHLADCLKEGELAALYKNDDTVRDLLDKALNLEGIARHASTHAAGVVIADKPLIEYVPLHRPTKEKGDDSVGVVTQYPMEDLEGIGLLKMDFLGLSTLTVMRHAVELIEQTRGERIDISKVPLDDPAIYKLLSSGNVEGVFQVESAGMRRVLTGLQPTQFEDVGAVIALYRPGPMQFIDSFIARKHGKEPITYRHPALEPILKETYGAIVYQEQVIQIMTDLAGYSTGDADLVRRAVGKKKEEELKKHRAGFIAGAKKTRNIPETIADQIWSDIEFFANYGFNKCVTADTRIVNACTGRLVTVGELYATQQKIATLSLSEDQRIQPRPIALVMSNGRKPVFRLRTRSGREIRATANHPFRTWKGWTLLQDLGARDWIATPRFIPYTPSTLLNEAQLVVLAGALSQGNLCHPTSFYIYTKDEAYLSDYVSHLEQFANTSAIVDRSKSAVAVYAKRKDRSQVSDAVQFIERLGLRYKKATAKFFPDVVFGLPLDQLQLFLGRLWSADGRVHPDTLAIYYATSSLELARGLQHLLLRLGILSTLHTKRFKYRGAWEERLASRPSCTVNLTGGRATMMRFAEMLEAYMVGQTRDNLHELLTRYQHVSTDRARASVDLVPVSVQQVMRDEMNARRTSYKTFAHQLGPPSRHFYLTKNKRGFRRDTRSVTTDSALESDVLLTQATSDIFWDEIVSIEPDGIEETYDLTIEGTHNFIANDFIVHNSHSADYALITCQTAWLKAHYPVEYMTALLSVERGNTEKVMAYTAECARLKIDVLPPDVNQSELDFAVERIKAEAQGRRGAGENAPLHPRPAAPPLAIRFGLGAIKNVGDAVVELIVNERKANGAFKSLEEFCERVDLRQVNKRALECLIKAGTFDAFGRRAQILAVLDRMVESSHRSHHAQSIGQLDLFGGALGAISLSFAPLPEVDEVPLKEKLNWEKELLGIYVSEHPLKRIMPYVETHTTVTVGQIDHTLNDQMIIIAGLVSGVRTITTKKGDLMAFVQLEDLQGTIEVTVFPRLYARSKALWQEDTAIVLRAKVEERDGKMKLLAESAEPLPQETSSQSADVVAEVGATRRVAPTKIVLTSAPILVAEGDNGWRARDARYARQKKVLHHHLFITIPRTGDHQQDIEKVGQVYELLQSYPGEDRFSIYTTNGAGRVLLDFPNATTRHSVQLQQKLIQLLGAGTVRVKVIEEVT